MTSAKRVAKWYTIKSHDAEDRQNGENRKMNKQQQTVLNMAGFIKSQSLTLLEKLDALDADEQAAMCEKLHELAEELQNSIQTRFEAESGTGV